MRITEYGFINKLKVLPFVEQIWLFGSRARGDAQERSDIDLAVVCPAALESEWYQVLSIVEDADTLLKVDCIRFDRLTKTDKIKENILKFKKIVYKKGENGMDTLFWKDYFDNLGQAIKKLSNVIRHEDFEKNDYMQDAAIQRFEFVMALLHKSKEKRCITP